MCPPDRGATRFVTPVGTKSGQSPLAVGRTALVPSLSTGALPPTNKEGADMTELTVTPAVGGHGRTALMLAVVSLVLYIGGGFTMGGIFWALGPLVGLCAIVLGVAVRHKGGGREATIAVILGAIPVLWTVAFLTVAALR